MITTESSGWDEHSGSGFAQNDIRFHCHADHQRCVIGQRQAHAIGLARCITFGRDLRHGRVQYLPRKSISAQQRALAFADLGDVFLIYLGSDAEWLWFTNPE